MSTMAKSVSVPNTNGHLSCSICQKQFTKMTLSSCFHTFCPSCLEGNIGNSTNRGHYECPICQTPIRPPTGRRNSSIHETGEMSTSAYNEPKYSTMIGEAVCDICDDGKHATNQCLQCKERFCDLCTRAHLKMKASRYHSDQVVPLHQVRDMTTDNFCPRHQSQEILFVCKKCDVVICNICKLMEHENHVTKLLSEEAKEVRQRLSSLLRNQTSYVDHLQMRLRMMNDKKYQYPHELEQEIEKVRKQATKMHLDIEREKSDAEKELEQHYNDYIDKANDSSEHLRRDYEQRSGLVQEAQQLLYSSNDLNFVHNGRYLCRRLEQTDSDSGEFGHNREHPYKRFVPGMITDPQSQRLVGVVTGDRIDQVPLANSDKTVYHSGGIYSPTSENSPKPHVSLSAHSARSSQASNFVQRTLVHSEPIKLQNVSSFRIPHDDISGYIYGIAPIAGQQLAWVTMLDHRNILLVDNDGNIVNSVDIGEPCEGVTSDAEGGCFITCPRSKSVLHVTSAGEVSPVMLNLGMMPHGIAGWQYFDIKKNAMIDEVYICFTDSQNAAWYEKPKGSVGVYSFLGQDLGKSIPFQSPVRVDVDLASKMMCIADHNNGCVTICDQHGENTTALYTGEDDEELFKPLGVCFDDTGHVIIADWNGGNVIRVSQNGILVQHLLTGIDGPQSVAMGNDGMLWVGSKKGHVSVYKVN